MIKKLTYLIIAALSLHQLPIYAAHALPQKNDASTTLIIGQTEPGKKIKVKRNWKKIGAIIAVFTVGAAALAFGSWKAYGWLMAKDLEEPETEEEKIAAITRQLTVDPKAVTRSLSPDNIQEIKSDIAAIADKTQQEALLKDLENRITADKTEQEKFIHEWRIKLEKITEADQLIGEKRNAFQEFERKARLLLPAAEQKKVGAALLAEHKKMMSRMNTLVREANQLFKKIPNSKDAKLSEQEINDFRKQLANMQAQLLKYIDPSSREWTIVQKLGEKERLLDAIRSNQCIPARLRR